MVTAASNASYLDSLSHPLIYFDLRLDLLRQLLLVPMLYGFSNCLALRSRQRQLISFIALFQPLTRLTSLFKALADAVPQETPLIIANAMMTSSSKRCLFRNSCCFLFLSLVRATDTFWWILKAAECCPSCSADGGSTMYEINFALRAVSLLWRAEQRLHLLKICNEATITLYLLGSSGYFS